MTRATRSRLAHIDQPRPATTWAASGGRGWRRAPTPTHLHRVRVRAEPDEAYHGIQLPLCCCAAQGGLVVRVHVAPALALSYQVVDHGEVAVAGGLA